MTLHPLLTALGPEIILVAAASLMLLAGLSKRRGTVDALPLVGLLAMAAALAVAHQLRNAGNEAPSIRNDALTYYVRLIGLSVGAVVLLVNRHVAEPRERAEFLALLLFSLAGLLTVAAADDLVLFFLGLEMVSIPTYILVGLSRLDIRAQEACGKYFFLGAFAAALLLYGLSFVYGVAGTTTMFGHAGAPSIVATFAEHPRGVSDALALVGLLLVIAGLAFKLAAVPFHFYAPDVYQGAASPIAGLLAFVPKFAGLVALVRVLSLIGWTLSSPLFWTLWALAAATMTVGNLLALMQHNAKRMLAYSSIAHSGYMLVAVVAGPGAAAVASHAPTRNGVAAALFYIAVYGLMNLGAFAALAYIRRDDDESVEEVHELAGAARRHPWACLALAICALSLMGVPPTAGFFGKLYIFSAAFAAADGSAHSTALIWLVILGVVNAAIAAAYYLRLVATCYLGTPGEATRATGCDALRAGLGICAAAMVLLFLFPETLANQAGRAAVVQPPVAAQVYGTAPTADLAAGR